MTSGCLFLPFEMLDIRPTDIPAHFPLCNNRGSARDGGGSGCRLERRRREEEGREGGRMEQSESDMRRSVGRSVGEGNSRLSTASIGQSTAGEMYAYVHQRVETELARAYAYEIY